MSIKLNDLRAPVQDEMRKFEGTFRESLKSNVPLLNRITHYIVKRKGKQMRPLLVFFSARLIGEITERTYRGAGLIELMHTASLVHDDVVDDSNLRRGFFSLNALWKNKIAVLVGDFMLSRVLLLAVRHQDFDLLEKVSDAVQEMSEGELLQIEKARRLDIEEDVYFDIIRQKTASLLKACCSVGAISAGGTEEEVQALATFGEKMGLAFQIKDDLFDYQSTNETGKPTMLDIQERKMTLPIIHTLKKCTSKEKRFVISTIKNHNTNKTRIAEVIGIVNKYDGITYAQNKLELLQDEALKILHSFPDSEKRKSLENMLTFVLNRNN
ncbi:MAG: polyprenyl synthetase family protein [Cryomorphaceae bacterium]|nr:polyprenyl synthetase family protein [Cryomorphaceae bacterium]